MIESCRACGAPNQVACGKLGEHARCGTCMRSLLPLVHPHAIHSKEELEELVSESPLPVVIDFWSPANDASRSVECDLERLARAGGTVVAKVNTDEVPDAAASFGVEEVPTLIRFRSGVEEARSAGATARDLIRAV